MLESFRTKLTELHLPTLVVNSCSLPVSLQPESASNELMSVTGNGITCAAAVRSGAMACAARPKTRAKSLMISGDAQNMALRAG
jgi:hypothetical protein